MYCEIAERLLHSADESRARSDTSAGFSSSAVRTRLSSLNVGWVTGNESVSATWIGSGAGTPMAWNSTSVWFSTVWFAVSRLTSAVPLATSALRTSTSVFWPTW